MTVERGPERGRRALLGLGLAALALPGLGLGLGRAHAAPPLTRDQRRLANRLELWASFSRKTRLNLAARYTFVRSSSLLREDLVGGGALAFDAPSVTLVLRDDDLLGSTTRVSPGAISIVPNDPSLPRRELPTRAQAPALGWLADHLVACFAPGKGEALTVEARPEIPRGGSRLSLSPPLDSVARALIRSMTLSLDPVSGAVIRVEIAEADGGNFSLRLSDHRQDIEADGFARMLNGDRG